VNTHDRRLVLHKKARRKSNLRWLERIRCVLIAAGGRIAAGEQGKEAGAVYI
jgi:hypothetical protein